MLAIISDVHGKTDQYRELCRSLNSEGYATLQLGDLGFGGTYKKLMEDSTFCVKQNRFFMGNHDQYDYLSKEHKEENKKRFNKFNLGTCGMRELGGIPYFFVRGAFSIDYRQRELYRSWWPEEEIYRTYWDVVIGEYKVALPDIMITHELPQSVGHDRVLKTDGILQSFGFRPESFSTNTGELLDKLFAIHQPKLWIFAHYHKHWTAKVNGTTFICMPELACLQLTPEYLKTFDISL